jgi:hypothetical protein
MKRKLSTRPIELVEQHIAIKCHLKCNKKAIKKLKNDKN